MPNNNPHALLESLFALQKEIDRCTANVSIIANQLDYFNMTQVASDLRESTHYLIPQMEKIMQEWHKMITS